MTQEEKELLLKDLCARLPYGIICTDSRHGDSRVFYIDIEDESVYYTDFDEYGLIENCKPYLRPMSDMTEAEKKEYFDATQVSNHCAAIDWLNSHYFDYRGLISIGIALPATKNMYNDED